PVQNEAIGAGGYDVSVHKKAARDVHLRTRGITSDVGHVEAELVALDELWTNFDVLHDGQKANEGDYDEFRPHVWRLSRGRENCQSGQSRATLAPATRRSGEGIRAITLRRHHIG